MLHHITEKKQILEVMMKIILFLGSPHILSLSEDTIYAKSRERQILFTNWPWTNTFHCEKQIPPHPWQCKYGSHTAWTFCLLIICVLPLLSPQTPGRVLTSSNSLTYMSVPPLVSDLIHGSRFSWKNSRLLRLGTKKVLNCLASI